VINVSRHYHHETVHVDGGDTSENVLKGLGITNVIKCRLESSVTPLGGPGKRTPDER